MNFVQLKRKSTLVSLLALTFLVSLVSCSVSDKPVPVKAGTDECTACKMVITDAKFACEIITAKGRFMKFDDVSCLFNYIKKQDISMESILKIYVADYAQSDQMIDIKEASLVMGADIHSPMNGGVAAFASKESATEFAEQGKATLLDSWEVLVRKH